MTPLADTDPSRTISDPPVGPGTHAGASDAEVEDRPRRGRGGMSLGRMAKGEYGPQARDFIKSLRDRGKTLNDIANQSQLARSTITNIIQRNHKPDTGSLAAFLIQITAEERALLGFQEWWETFNSTAPADRDVPEEIVAWRVHARGIEKACIVFAPTREAARSIGSQAGCFGGAHVLWADIKAGRIPAADKWAGEKPELLDDSDPRLAEVMQALDCSTVPK